MNRKKLIELLIFIVSAELVGALSALFTGSFSTAYDVMQRPPMSPPAFLFPVVWTILYAVMGASAYLMFVSRVPQYQKGGALKIYGAQLIVNFFWSIIYFRLEMRGVALLDILVLDMLVALMILRFYRIRPISGIMNLPYMLWLLFATYLNLATVILN